MRRDPTHPSVLPRQAHPHSRRSFLLHSCGLTALAGLYKQAARGQCSRRCLYALHTSRLILLCSVYFCPIGALGPDGKGQRTAGKPTQNTKPWNQSHENHGTGLYILRFFSLLERYFGHFDYFSEIFACFSSKFSKIMFFVRIFVGSVFCWS